MKLTAIAKATLALGDINNRCDDSRKSNCKHESKVG